MDKIGMDNTVLLVPMGVRDELSNKSWDLPWTFQSLRHSRRFTVRSHVHHMQPLYQPFLILGVG